MSDLSIEALTAVFNAGVKSCPYQAIEVAKGYGIRAVLAALAEAAGDPEALGRVLYEAASHDHASRFEDDDLPPWAEAGEDWQAAAVRVALPVAAAAVARVREREVQPLLSLLRSIGHLLGSLAVDPALGEADRPPRTSCRAYAEEIDALGGGDRGR